MANELTIFIDADTSGLQQCLQQAEREVNNFQSRIQGIADIGQKLAGLGAVITAGLTLPILALGKASITAYGDIQSLKMGLTAVMGSASKAESEFKKLIEVAKLPGLGLKDAVKGSVSLQAAGFSADLARRSLMAFGNALATVGKGANELGFVNLALTQIQNKTSGYGQDLRQLTEQLPQLRTALESAFGSSNSEEIAKSGKTGMEVVEALIKEFEKLPKVTGGINNAFENLSDNIFTNLGRIGKVIDDNLDISGIVEKLTGYIDSAVSAFEGLDPTLQKVILGIAGVTAVAGPLLLAVGGFMALLPTLTAGVTALGAVFGALLSPIGLVTVAIVGLVGAVVANWGKIKPYLDDTVERFKTLYKESAIFRLGITTLGASIEGFARSSVSVLKTFYTTFVDLGKGVLNIFKGIGEGIEGVMTFDVTKIAKGFARVTTAPLSFISDMTRNSISGVAELNAIFVKTFDKWNNLDISGFKIPEIFGNEIETKTKEGVLKGLDKAKAETKTKVPEIEEVKPINLQSRGFVDGLGNEFKTLNDLMLAEAMRTQMIMGTYFPFAFTYGMAKAKKAIEDAMIEEDLAKLNESLTTIVSQGVVNGITDTFASIGTAIADGTSVISAVGKSLLGSFGKLLQDFGKQLITYGVGMIAVKLAMKNPYLAIAAGAALVALGAGLSASVDKTVAGSDIGGSGVSSSTGGSANTNYSSSYSSNGNSGGDVIFRISGPDLIGAINRNLASQDRLNSI